MKEPKIRFKGFSGEWKECTLSNIITVNSGKDYKHLEKGTIPVYGTGGYMLSVNTSLSEHDAIGIGRKGTIDKPQYLKAPFWTVDTLFFLTTNNGDNLDFLFNLSQNIRWQKYDESTGVPSLSKNNIDKIKTCIPNKFEQQSVASFFTSLDAQISASTTRLASLKQMKAASLQAMFPQEGETVPKVRFKGFEGEWKKVKFDKAFSFLKNNSLSRAELCNDGDIINIHYGDVLIKYGDILDIGNDEVIYVADSNVANKLYTDCPIVNGDIIIADAAEDFTVGKCVEVQNVTKQKIVSGLHTIPCRPLESTAPNFWGYYINSNSFHRQLLPMIQGSKISSISKTSLSATYVVFPVVEEQQSIASFFTSLDRQIALHAKRLEKLKQIKATCLDKMFV